MTAGASHDTGSPISWRDVYTLVAELRSDTNDCFSKIETRLGLMDARLSSLQIHQATSDAADKLEDTLAVRKTAAFRWQTGIWLAAGTGVAGILLSMLHLVFGVGA